MPAFAYQDPLAVGADSTKYRRIGQDGVAVAAFEGQDDKGNGFFEKLS